MIMTAPLSGGGVSEKYLQVDKEFVSDLREASFFSGHSSFLHQ
jgi:hypothetical protein